MTRKDFELIAAALRSVQVGGANGYHVATNEAERERDGQRMAMHRAACLSVANALQSTNPRFDRDRFLTASGFVL